MMSLHLFSGMWALNILVSFVYPNKLRTVYIYILFIYLTLQHGYNNFRQLQSQKYVSTNPC